MIIGISGKKQSGKSTSGNFLYSLIMVESGVCSRTWINNEGKIEISDLMGDTNYQRTIFDPCLSRQSSDWNIKKALDILDPIIKIYNFADTLKQNICIDILGMTYDQCYGSDEDKNTLTDLYWDDSRLSARDAMQLIGTDLFRKLKRNVWAEATLNKILKEQPRIAIITDCRFPNEVQEIKNNGGKVVRLTKQISDAEHDSETILDKHRYDWSNFDYIIENQSMSIFDQCIKLNDIFRNIKESVLNK